MSSKNITIKLINGNKFTTEVDETVKISELKEKAMNFLGIQDNFSLIFKGKIMEDDKLVFDYPDVDSIIIIGHIKRQKKDANLIQKPRPTPPPLNLNNGNSIFRNSTIAREPDNFDDLVTNLVELGFPKSDCELALRSTHYIIDSAATMLMQGTLPKPVNKAPHNDQDVNFLIHRFESQLYAPTDSQIETQQTPTLLHDRLSRLANERLNAEYSQREEEQQHEEEEREEEEEHREEENSNEEESKEEEEEEASQRPVQQQPHFVSRPNILSNGLPFLPPNEKQEVDRLVAMTGVTFAEAEQIYLLCNKDVNSAAQLLSSG